MKNKFYIDLNLELSFHPNYINRKEKEQKQMSDWCLERLGKGGPGVWEFSKGYDTTYKSRFMSKCLFNGIFIFDDEARTAFKLTFGV